MKLNVAIVRQPSNSQDCGIACVAMILKYYKVSYDYDKLRKEIGVRAYGTATPQLGLWLLRHGFDVEIVSLHPALFHVSSTFRSRAALLRHLKSLRRVIKKPASKTVLEDFIAFVGAGGTLTPRVPAAQDIRKEIAAKRPVISLLTHYFLHGKKERPFFTFHFNVVTGINTTSVYVNDPDSSKMGGRSTHAIANYLYAIYATAFGEIDNACLMKITKR